MSDTTTRSLLKTITWRITGSGATFVISYLILGNFTVASTIAVTQLIANTMLYFIHERVWNKIKWGKHKDL
jgi:uncharacterized membrane protein